MKYNLAYKLLSVDTNLDNIYYFPYVLWLDNLIKGRSKIKFGFYVKHDIQKPANLSQNFDYFWGAPGSNKIYYEHFIVPGIKAKLLMDLSKDKWDIYVNSNYYRFSKYKFENVWPPGRHLTSLVTARLLKEKKVLLHCAGFSDKESSKGYLVFGASNTGKSYTTFKAIDDGYDYHSEDLTIVSDKAEVYKTPLVSAMSDKLPNQNFALKYNLFVSKLTGLNMFIPKINNTKSFKRFFKNYDYKSTAKLDKIFILEKGKRLVNKPSKEEAIRKIAILNRIELHYYRDHLLNSYNYFNDSFNVNSLELTEKNIITKLVRTSDTYLIKSPTPELYYKELKNIIV